MNESMSLERLCSWCNIICLDAAGFVLHHPIP